MQTVGNQAIEILRRAYLARQQKNAAYSLRAFARDLHMSQALLSLVMNGKRPVTVKLAYKISSCLQLSESDRAQLLGSALLKSSEGATRTKVKTRVLKSKLSQFDIELERFQVVADWYHFAIMDLTTTVDFQSDTAWIAKRLGISKIQVEGAINRLVQLKLLEQAEGRIKKTNLHIKVDPKKSVAAIRLHHAQMIEKAKNALSDPHLDSFKKRSITGTTLAIDASRIDEAKADIEKFQNEFIKKFTAGNPNEVYQMNLQLFALSQNPKPKNKKKKQE